MVKEAEIYKSSIPAQYGGRISSILDITGKEANKEKFTGSAGIGLVTSKLNLEIPIIKDRTSVLLSGRTTYSDWIMKQLPEKSGYKTVPPAFMIWLLLWHINSMTNIVLMSTDTIVMTVSLSIQTKNTATIILNASARWRAVFNEN